ncbi:MAG: flagellar biosynthetic protein FliP, partial [Lentisphaerota bacterium]
MKSFAGILLLILVISAGLPGTACAKDLALKSDTNAAIHPLGLKVQIDPANSPSEVTQSIKILLLLTLLSLAPSAIIMTTSFTRILIVLGFLRQALGT